eukprot:8443546-Pyramimonas_sp.AAC.1
MTEIWSSMGMSATEELRQAKERAAQVQGDAAEAARTALKGAGEKLQSAVQAVAAKGQKRG